MKKAIRSVLLILIVFSAVVPIRVNADDVDITNIKPNQTKTLWSGWNVKGKLHFKVKSQNEDELCITAWWNKLGKNTTRFQLCDGDSLDYRIPAYIFARLKVGWPSSETVVAVSGSAAVVSSYELCGRHLDC